MSPKQKRKPTVRVRVARCVRQFDKWFPFDKRRKDRDIHWSHAINTARIEILDTPHHPFAQVMMARGFFEACAKRKMQPGDPVWERIGLVLLNEPKIDPVTNKPLPGAPWHLIEHRRLVAEFRRVIEELQRKYPKPPGTIRAPRVAA